MQKTSKKSEKQKIEQEKEKISVTRVIRDNCAWIIAGLTFLGVIVSNVLKFIEFITSQTYFSYFGIDQNLYNYSDKKFIYELCLSIIFILAFFSVFYCFKQLKENIKKKELFKWENLINILLILISNFYIVINTPGQLNLISIIILMLLKVMFSLDKINNDNTYASNDEIMRTEIIKNIESDFLKLKLNGLNIEDNKTDVIITFNYENTAKKLIVKKDSIIWNLIYQF